MIRDIQRISTEVKSYCGIDTVEHVCRIQINGKEHFVKLIYTKESCKWSLIEI